MMKIICGVDVCKARLDACIAPSGTAASFDNDAAGIGALAAFCRHHPGGAGGDGSERWLRAGGVPAAVGGWHRLRADQSASSALTVQKQRRAAAADFETLASLDEVIALFKRQSRTLEGRSLRCSTTTRCGPGSGAALREVKGVAGRTVAHPQAVFLSAARVDHARLRITENAAHCLFRSKIRERIGIPQPPASLRSSCHPTLMPNSTSRRNA